MHFLSLFISDRDKNLNWRRIPSKVFSLCAPQCDMQIGGGEGLRCSPTSEKKKKRNAGNYHKTNNERLCRKVFEERS